MFTAQRHVTRLTLVGMLLVILFSVAVAAQTPIANPRGFVFTKSDQNDAIDPVFKLPIIQGYKAYIQWLDKNNSPQVIVMDLGKPVFDSNGEFTVTPPDFLNRLTPGFVYNIIVGAYGPGGEGLTGASDPFGRSIPPDARPTVKPRLIPR